MNLISYRWLNSNGWTNFSGFVMDILMHTHTSKGADGAVFRFSVRGRVLHLRNIVHVQMKPKPAYSSYPIRYHPFNIIIVFYVIEYSMFHFFASRRNAATVLWLHSYLSALTSEHLCTVMYPWVHNGVCTSFQINRLVATILSVTNAVTLVFEYSKPIGCTMRLHAAVWCVRNVATGQSIWN